MSRRVVGALDMELVERVFKQAVGRTVASVNLYQETVVIRFTDGTAINFGPGQ